MEGGVADPACLMAREQRASSAGSATPPYTGL